MRESLQIGLAAPADAEQIVEIFSTGFDPWIWEKTIYACHGAVRYVQDLIRVQDVGGDTAFVVARADDEVAGCAEFRRFPDALFLNYISVREVYRGQGIARQLLAHAIQTLGQSVPRIRLDVFEHNETARHWYQRLDFRVESTSEWWTMPLPLAPSGHAATLSNYPQAEACQDTLGFSQFEVRTDRGVYTVGRLGAKWFRLTGHEALEDRELLTTLATLDPLRSVLAIIPTAQRARRPFHAKRVGRLERMAAERAPLLRALTCEPAAHQVP